MEKEGGGVGGVGWREEVQKLGVYVTTLHAYTFLTQKRIL
jgi:hypothetical protein